MNTKVMKNMLYQKVVKEKKEIENYNLNKITADEKKKFNSNLVIEIVNKFIDNEIKNEFIKLEDDLKDANIKIEHLQKKISNKKPKIKSSELKFIKECIEKYDCSKIRVIQLYEEKFNKKITKYQLNNICKEHNIKFIKK